MTVRDCVKKTNEFPTNGVSVFTIVFFSRIDFYCPPAGQEASGSARPLIYWYFSYESIFLFKLGTYFRVTYVYQNHVIY